VLGLQALIEHYPPLAIVMLNFGAKVIAETHRVISTQDRDSFAVGDQLILEALAFQGAAKRASPRQGLHERVDEMISPLEFWDLRRSIFQGLHAKSFKLQTSRLFCRGMKTVNRTSQEEEEQKAFPSPLCYTQGAGTTLQVQGARSSRAARPGQPLPQ